jgi:hypothetical protein
MQIPKFDEEGFPLPPTLKARWAPLFFEPIRGSGERLTVAIIIKSGTEAQIRSVLRSDAIRMLYGRHSAGIRGLVELTVDSLSVHLKKNKTPATWAAPVSGFFPGDFRNAVSSSIDGIVAQAIQRCASLSSLNMFDITQEAAKAENEQAAVRLVDRVKDVVSKRKLELVPYFNQAGKLVDEGRPIRFGFLGKGVVAHFQQLRPIRIFESQFNARARLWELSRAHHLLESSSSACLILQLPRVHDINFSPEELRATESAFEELVEEAKSESLSISRIHDEQEGADEIIKLAAAA